MLRAAVAVNELRSPCPGPRVLSGKRDGERWIGGHCRAVAAFAAAS